MPCVKEIFGEENLRIFREIFPHVWINWGRMGYLQADDPLKSAVDMAFHHVLGNGPDPPLVLVQPTLYDIKQALGQDRELVVILHTPRAIRGKIFAASYVVENDQIHYTYQGGVSQRRVEMPYWFYRGGVTIEQVTGLPGTGDWRPQRLHVGASEHAIDYAAYRFVRGCPNCTPTIIGRTGLEALVDGSVAIVSIGEELLFHDDSLPRELMKLSDGIIAPGSGWASISRKVAISIFRSYLNTNKTMDYAVYMKTMAAGGRVAGQMGISDQLANPILTAVLYGYCLSVRIHAGQTVRNMANVKKLALLQELEDPSTFPQPLESVYFWYYLRLIFLIVLGGTMVAWFTGLPKLNLAKWNDYKNSYNMGWATPYTGPALSSLKSMESEYPITVWNDSRRCFKRVSERKEGAKIRYNMIPVRCPPRPALAVTTVGFSNHPPSVFNRSPHNLMIAIETRAIKKVPLAEEGAWKDAYRLAAPILTGIKGGFGCMFWVSNTGGTKTKAIDVDYEYFVSRFPGPKQRRLRDYKERYEHGELDCLRKFSYQGHMKLEKACIHDPSNPDAFEAARPRFISGCSWYAKNLVGPWFLGLSKAFKLRWGMGEFGLDGAVFYAGGRNSDEMNEWFGTSMQFMEERAVVINSTLLFVSSDYSKYDLTQGPDCLDEQQQFYRDVGIGNHVPAKELEWLFKMKKNATVYTDIAKFSVPGTRKSGEMDTSIGNSISTGVAAYSFYSSHGIPVRMAVLGDDNYGIVAKGDVLRVFGSVEGFKHALIKWNERLGLILKVTVNDTVVGGEFLSSRFYPVTNSKHGFVLGKKPGRVLAKLGYHLLKNGTCPDLDVIRSTMISLLPVANHVPFLRKFIRVMLETVGRGPVADLDPYRTQGSIHNADATTWGAFVDRYGLDYDDELAFEQELRDHVKTYGLQSMMVNTYVDHLYAVDCELDGHA